ncbi:MAG TPA: MotA/TolQ/ExbB proton channel family protein, partial [Planctomycetota bacterium]|nr:MotA/TolQ/ExbB proton channel family protein [Planctomycetota bacterium]
QQPSVNDGALVRVSSSASEQLAKSTAELDALRERIAAEKLPLAQQLTAAEEQLAALRKEHEEVTRLVDSGNLQLPAIRAEMKAREDEQVYLGNLLDEYARNFETKVNVAELQVCGDAIADARQATENTTLAPAERFGRQISFVQLSVKRLFDALGGERFPGTGVDLAGAVVSGEFALIGPVALFRATSGMAGLVIPQTGSTRPLIRPLEGSMQLGLAALVESGAGDLPLDPSRGGALKELVQKTNLIHVFEKGGPIMWPLLVCSILALGVVLERVIFLLGPQRRRDPKAMEGFFAAAGRGDTEAAIRIGNESKFYVVRTLAYALSHKETSLPNALLYAQSLELKRFRRGIPILDTVITLAPLLGLLGTVTGMMGSFSLIGGDLSAPGAITGGIAEALIATAFGLGIAITSLIPFNILNTRADEARAEIESAATQLELLVHPQAGGPPPEGPGSGGQASHAGQAGRAGHGPALATAHATAGQAHGPLHAGAGAHAPQPAGRT